MSLPTDPRPARMAVAPAVALLLLIALAAPVAAAPFGVADETAESLLAELEARYDVIVLSRGYAVRPLGPDAGFELIEVDEEGLLIDGRRRELAALGDLLGDDAALLTALSGDADALESLEERRRQAEERRRQTARELQENIRRQFEELEQLDTELVEEVKESIGRRRPRVRRVRTETRVALGSSLTVRENESARDVVVILGPLYVRGEVGGDSVVVLSNAEISGRLEGHLTVVGGNVSIGPEAEIDGDVNCIGGVVHQAEGARVEGEITEVSMAPFSVDVPGFELEGFSPFRSLRWDRGGFRWFKMAGTIFATAFLAFLVLLTVMVARHRVDAVAERARLEPWKSGLIGFVVQVLSVPVAVLISVLLIVSVVGIPVLMVAVPLGILVFWILLCIGYSGVAVALGRAVRGRRFDPQGWSPYLAVLVGLVLIQSWHILGEGLSFAGGLLRIFGYLLILFGVSLKYLAWTIGLGAVLLDRFSPLPVAGGGYVPPPPAPYTPPAQEAASSPWEDPGDELFEQEAAAAEPDSEYLEAGKKGDP